MSCPFYAGSMITEPRYFVGRREYLDFLTSRMSAAQPTSINLVGKQRFGKSSLLYHFCQTYEQRVQRFNQDPRRYVVIYLSLQQGDCRREEDFYRAVARSLLRRSVVQTNSALATPLNSVSLQRQSFSDAIKAWQKEKVLPVLCLDKFEELLENKQEFDDYFYDNLRSLMNSNALMLIISSKQTLERYSKKHQLTSDFFNLGNVKVLTKLTEVEALDLVRLPDINNPALSPERQKLALQWGERHPYLLQLAGRCLWEAQTQHRPDSWAKEEFLQASQNVPQTFSWQKFVGKLLWLPLKLGRMARFTGDKFDDTGNLISGTVILIVLCLVVFKILPFEELVKLLKDALGIGG